MTRKRFNTNDQLEKLYIEVPKALLYETKYKPNKSTGSKGLSNAAKLLYGILLDRTYLSLSRSIDLHDSSFVDENGDAFIYFDNASIEEILNVSTKKAIDLKKELIAYDLLEEVPQGQGLSNKLYLIIVETKKENLKLYTSSFKEVVNSKKESEKNRISKYRKEKSETVENTMYCKNYSTSTVKNKVLVLSNLQSSNTNSSNTDNVSMYVCSPAKAEENKNFLNLYEKHLVPSKYIKKVLSSIEKEDKLTYELLELIIIKALNKKDISDNEKWIVSTINKLISKGIKTVEEYEASVKDYSKTYKSNSKKKESNTKDKPVKTRFHNVKQTFTKYSPDELEKILLESQKGKFKDLNEKDVTTTPKFNHQF